MSPRLTAAAEQLTRSAAGARQRSSEPEPVFITLSPGQVADVVRAASGSGRFSALLSESTVMPDISSRIDINRVSASLLNGMLVLARLPADGSLMRNAEIAAALGMSPANVHRYLKTLVVVGLVERDARTRKYRRRLLEQDSESRQYRRTTDSAAASSAREHLRPAVHVALGPDRTERDGILRAFGQNLKSARTAAGLSQSVLAERCFLRLDHVSALERGKTAPSLTVLLTLAQSTGTSLLGLTEGLAAPSRRPTTRKMRVLVARQPGIGTVEMAHLLGLPTWYVGQNARYLWSRGEIARRLPG